MPHKKARHLARLSLALSLSSFCSISFAQIIDTDLDGIPDDWEQAYYLDPTNPADATEDHDNDLLTNLQEYQKGTHPTYNDTDHDHVIDGEDIAPTDYSRALDSDGDGMHDAYEILAGYYLNLDDPSDAQHDIDSDGLTNLQEYQLGTHILEFDTDNDGIADGEDVAPLDRRFSLDSDADGLPDRFEESEHFLDPYFGDDAAQDFDADGISNLEEFKNNTDLKHPDSDRDGVFDIDDPAPLNPAYSFDSDNDGLPDTWEMLNGTQVNTPDQFLDGDGDRLNNLQEYLAGTDVTQYDSDGDGVMDGEDHFPTHPVYTFDHDRDGMPREYEERFYLSDYSTYDGTHDEDGDGLINSEEYKAGTWPTLEDSDSDGVNDKHDLYPTDPKKALDSDHDGIPDAYEILHKLDPYASLDALRDYDGDNLTNIREYLLGTLVYKSDSDDDGVEDGEDAFPTDPRYSHDDDADGLPNRYEWDRHFLDAFWPHDAYDDYDNDQLNNLQEFLLGTNPEDNDSDNDGVDDHLDVAPLDSRYSIDDDRDGLPDEWEQQYGIDYGTTYSADHDDDGDYLTNIQEYRLGTDPTHQDSDGDGVADGLEHFPLDPVYTVDQDRDTMPREYEQRFYLHDDDTHDGARDNDYDGLTNAEEFAKGTDVDRDDTDQDGVRDYDDLYPNDRTKAFDYDRDGMHNAYEILQGLDASYEGDALEDHDYDGLNNIDEYRLGTDPNAEDTDKDGILDGDDRFPLNAQYWQDSDGDGMPNAYELRYMYVLSPDYPGDAQGDHDGDGLSNLEEFQLGADLERDDSDNDGYPDGLDFDPLDSRYALDSDGDGMPDSWESQYYLDPYRSDGWADQDGDFSSNLQEFLQGTLPDNQDSDGDYIEDGADHYPLDPRYTRDLDRDGMPKEFEERYHQLNDDVTYDGNGDIDGDDLTNAQEFALGTLVDREDTDGDGVRDGEDLYPLDRTKALDSDGDGIHDAYEVVNQLDPYYPADAHYDEDDDGLSNLDEYLLGTDILLSDSDGDKYSDAEDAFPLNADYHSDSDNDGLPDAYENLYPYFLDPYFAEDAEQDFDADGFNNLQEFQAGTSPDNEDSDSDGVEDGLDVAPTNPDYRYDSDGDGMPDAWEEQNNLSPHYPNSTGDYDYDGVTDLQEFLQGTSPDNQDSDGDGLIDSDDHFPLDSRYTVDNDRDGMPREFEERYHDLSDDNVFDGGENFDDDSLNNTQEYLAGTKLYVGDSDIDGVKDGEDLYPLDRTKALDSDFDGIHDAYEVIYRPLPYYDIDPNEDWDADGLSNFAEYQLGTNINKADTDGDMVDDGQDLFPLDSRYHEDSDGDGIPNAYEVQHPDALNPTDAGDAEYDFDGDGLNNLGEFLLGTDIYYYDSDNDGESDGTDFAPTNPEYRVDSDGDGMPDAWEYDNGFYNYEQDHWQDSDGDLLTNLEEFLLGTNPNDSDSDQDGMDDGLEHYPLNPEYTLDYDRDGMPKEFEQRYSFILSDENTFDGGEDLDGDGLTNSQEYMAGSRIDLEDTDFDGIGDNEDLYPSDRTKALDSDNDGMHDAFEIIYLLDPHSLDDAGYDADYDGLTNLEEYRLGTHPLHGDTDRDGTQDPEDRFPLDPRYSADSDEDGIPDAFESAHSYLDPYSPWDAEDDLDGDGLSNLQEYLLGTKIEEIDSDLDGVEDGNDFAPTNPNYRYDSDGDGMPDAWEYDNYLESYRPDGAEDSDYDDLTNLQEFLLGTSPLEEDTDGDGLFDGADHFPLNPQYTQDKDRDGMPKEFEQINGLNDDNTFDGSYDFDGDSVPNSLEYMLGTNINLKDTDQDGVRDNEDLFPLDRTKARDDDGDGMPNAYEILNFLSPDHPSDALADTDGDGVSNLDEYRQGTDIHVQDSDRDGISDLDDAFPTNGMYSEDYDKDGLPTAYEDRYHFLDDYSPQDANEDGDYDGLNNYEEFLRQTDPELSDTDSDGTEDGEDIAPTNALYSQDDDQDGMPDEWENNHYLDTYRFDAMEDADQDFLTNIQEYLAGTDPNNSDSDGDYELDGLEHFPLDSSNTYDRDADGMPREYEEQFQLNDDDIWDAINDWDVDGLTNAQEYKLGTHPEHEDSDGDGVLDGEDRYPLDPGKALDSDGDGMHDSFELIYQLDPFYPHDANDDLDSDGLSNLEEYQLGTKPHIADSDQDGYLDGYEAFPTDANYHIDDDLDGLPRAFEETYFFLGDYYRWDAQGDYDNDGLSNLQEFLAGTFPDNQDSDGDGFKDGEDIAPNDHRYNSDYDRDGLPDYWEFENGTDPYGQDAYRDDDGDLSTNMEEYLAGTHASNSDSDGDGIHDGIDMHPLDSRYTFDADRDGLPQEWEEFFGLNDHDASDAGNDDDGDGIINLDEFLQELDPGLREFAIENNVDIGTIAIPGSLTQEQEGYTIVASGNNIWGPMDSFHFAYQEIADNVDIAVRVDHLEHAHQWTKAGLMIRESLDMGSRNVATFITPDNGAIFQSREYDYQSTSIVGKAPAALGSWLRIQRDGNKVSSYVSQDGDNWTLLGQVDDLFTGTFYLGLAVVSTDNSQTTQALFSKAKRLRSDQTNTLPTISISEELDNAVFQQDTSITLSGSAQDKEDGNKNAEILWSSNTYGAFASGETIDASFLPAGIHTITASVTDSHGATATTSVTIAIHSLDDADTTVFTQSLEIGQNHAPGQVDFDGYTGTYAMTTTGTDIWSYTDRFFYVYREMEGDIDIRARVAELEAAGPWSKTGLIIRASLDISSVYAATMITAENGAAFQGRHQAHTETFASPLQGFAAQDWVRIQKQGSLVTSYVSHDGENWTAIDETHMAFPERFFVGIASLSAKAQESVYSSVDSVSFVRQ